MNNEIKVSVCCITFNHEKYIKQTLEGFVTQETNFNFEVLIHDDASTDGTADIIRDYAERYPDIIKPILQTENQHSKGIKINPTFNYTRAQGRYIAFCEGDDYWTDPQKLQQQYDALESRPNCSICVHKTRHVDKEGIYLDAAFPSTSIPEGVISSDKYIHMELVENPWLFQTSSYFLRRIIIDKYLEGFRHAFPVGDLPLVLLSLQYGNCYYIAKEMSCYRKDSGGAMSKIRDSDEKAISHYQRMINGYTQFDAYTQKKYHCDFQYAINFATVQIYKISAKYKEILAPEYKEIRKRLNKKNQILIYVGAVFPRLAHNIFEFVRKRNRNG